MHLFGLDITWRGRAASLRTTAPVSALAGGRGWYPIVREPFTGAWQQNQEIAVSDVLSYGPVYACVKTIAQDCGKLPLRLMEQDPASKIWTETSNPAYSPLLRKPNRYQTRIKFVEQWITSKLIWGNTYVLKERDARGVVTALYVLNPSRVRVLVAPDGGVYYALTANPLAELDVDRTVPASEIIHDTMVCLYHPLCGVSPIYACGLAASQGLAIQQNSSAFFSNGSTPGGVILVPGAIDEDQANRVKAKWQAAHSGANAGSIAILPEGMTYESAGMNAVDAELIKQLQWTGEDICSCFGVPPWLVGIGPAPPYANFTPLVQAYYSEAIQPLLANFELVFDEGIGILTPVNGTQYGSEFDIDDLLWMDQELRWKVAAEGIKSGAMTPNEARQQNGLPPIAGGDTAYMQEQNWPLAKLEMRDLPTRAPTPPAPLPPAAPPPEVTKDLPLTQIAALTRAYLAEALERVA